MPCSISANCKPAGRPPSILKGNAALVKQCEHPDCILWFYHRTKAHKRPWCSMALCGNRHKAAQFRKRSGG
ncbi:MULTISPECIES: CGNR zinc finger domain-containing protein [Rheinheimera]|uniref:CGNR zinc finger domain-containing protein n=1 Tax=Rheinheimera marina TaxID=1774958 RepID=A0ABV9JPM1_9GAMM